MERIAFLVEPTGERIPCLLNPESVVLRRRAGIVPRRVEDAPIGAAGGQDSLLLTGGGSTELTLDLLFDVELAPDARPDDDVRRLTRPLWELSEGRGGLTGAKPRLVRMVWGKAWNLLGAVSAVAERLEHFSAAAVPRRSWLRMRLMIVQEPSGDADPPRPSVVARFPELAESPFDHWPEWGSTDDLPTVPDIGTALPFSEDDRLDTLAARFLGSPADWPLLAAFNDIGDPLRLEVGMGLALPAGLGEPGLGEEAR